MSKLVKKFRKGDYEDDNYYSTEEYEQKKKVRKDKQRKLRYFDEYESHQHYTRPVKQKSY